MSSTLPVVYHNLDQVIRALVSSKISKTSEIRQLLKVSATGVSGVLDPNTLLPRVKHIAIMKPKLPFIVVEGLDGSGKTKVSTALSTQLDMDLYRTPPDKIMFLKEFFDELDEPIRRAYYSLGNYLAAQQVSNSSFKKGIIMDRYWHSTASYAIAQQGSSDSLGKLVVPSDFRWPSDLLKPNLVIFLNVSEKVRQHRHAIRNTTNTKEEQILASDSEFRERLMESYRKINGVPFEEISANEEIEVVITKICDYVANKYPLLLGYLHTSKTAKTL